MGPPVNHQLTLRCPNGRDIGRHNQNIISVVVETSRKIRPIGNVTSGREIQARIALESSLLWPSLSKGVRVLPTGAPTIFIYLLFSYPLNYCQLSPLSAAAAAAVLFISNILCGIVIPNNNHRQLDFFSIEFFSTTNHPLLLFSLNSKKKSIEIMPIQKVSIDFFPFFFWSFLMKNRSVFDIRLPTDICARLVHSPLIKEMEGGHSFIDCRDDNRAHHKA